MILEDEALKILQEKISKRNENLTKHMIAVSTIMKSLSRKFGQDEKTWHLTGLLHDIDYEEVEKDMNRHGLVSAEMLEGKLPEDCLHAIKAHNRMTGVKAESLLDKALLSADAASGLIVAAALVMPNKKLSEVKVETLIKKMKDKSFARSVDRRKIRVCNEINLKTEKFLDLALRSLQGISDKLGL